MLEKYYIEIGYYLLTEFAENSLIFLSEEEKTSSYYSYFFSKSTKISTKISLLHESLKYFIKTVFEPSHLLKFADFLFSREKISELYGEILDNKYQ